MSLSERKKREIQAMADASYDAMVALARHNLEKTAIRTRPTSRKTNPGNT